MGTLDTEALALEPELCAEKPQEQDSRGLLLELRTPCPVLGEWPCCKGREGKAPKDHHLPRVSHVVVGRTEVDDFWKS